VGRVIFEPKVRDRYDGTSVRSVVRAIPPDHAYAGGEPWYLVESDYKGAELLVGAIASGDMVMLDHCQRNQLPEHDPNFFDTHSNLTVSAFRLPCAPTKAGLASIGKKHLRNGGKAVVFGYMYGRTAKAIAIALRQEGVNITLQEAQQFIDALEALYPDLKIFLNSCRARVKVGFIATMFGRYRRFPFTRDEQQLKKMEREAMNAPIQGAVADAMNMACHNIQAERKRLGMRFKLPLAIHDAVLLQVPESELHEVCRPDGLLKRAMVDQVPLMPRDLDGRLLLDGEIHRFGYSVDVHTHWGELLLADHLMEIGLPPEFVGWGRIPGGWQHFETETKVMDRDNNGKSKKSTFVAGSSCAGWRHGRHATVGTRGQRDVREARV